MPPFVYHKVNPRQIHCKKVRTKQFPPPWITAEYKQFRYTCDSLKAKAILEKKNLSPTTEYWKLYKSTRNKANYLKTKLKALKIRKVIASTENNQCDTAWKLFKNTTGGHRKQTKINFLKCNNVTLKNEKINEYLGYCKPS